MLFDPKWEIDEVGEHLLRAANMLQQKGWCQGQAIDVRERLCVLAALQLSVRMSDITLRDARMRLADYLGVEDVVDWNDAKGRTQEEVILALRAAGLTHARLPG